MLKLHKRVLESKKKILHADQLSTGLLTNSDTNRPAKQQHGCKKRSNRNELVHTRYGQFLRSY